MTFPDPPIAKSRQFGLIIVFQGSLLLVMAAEPRMALGGCTHDIECDDGLPCTVDICQFPVSGPVGSGTCVHPNVTDGQPGGIANCPSEFGLLCGGCDDGLFCNGLETCQSGACAAGTPPCSGQQVCSESFDLCQDQACAGAADCSNPSVVGSAFAAVAALTCNGVETCEGGVCVAGTNPCGFGGLCAEKRCSMPGNPNFPSALNEPCFTDTDCFDALIPNSTCSISGPVCQRGRCCTGTTEPLCGARFKNQGRCAGGGPNQAAPCRSGADCANGNCSTAGGNQTCDLVGGVFYGSDEGIVHSGDGPACGIDDNYVEVRCPKYGAGVVPNGPFLQMVGPISESPVVLPPSGSAIKRLGDDYRLGNPGVCAGGSRNGLGCGVNGDCPGGGVCELAATSVISLYYIRLVGGLTPSTRVVVEFRDLSGSLVAERYPVQETISGLERFFFDPPVIVPSAGFVIFRVASEFTPNGRFIWASTDGVDVGGNDPDVLWVNDGPVANFLSPNPGILAFEIEGQKVPAPLGACCDSDGATCTNGVLPWVCEGDGNHFQGPGTSCPIPACDTGACCAPTTGQCSVGTETECNSSNGEFQGFGTDCDADHGHEAASQHCCLQPMMGGADHCEDAVVHPITVPLPGQPPAVVTITGDNSPATFHVDDFCCPPNVECPFDLGWWEAFEIDKEAYLRIDFCCSDPTHRPASRSLYASCPCGATIDAEPNPFRFPEAEWGEGEPYCGDGNRWVNFGPLPAGIYYYRVASAKVGTHGPYQMHITVDPVATAACCVGDQCTANVTQLQCDALDGMFLAPPQRFPVIADCSNDPCATGSCCLGPGECFDVAIGQPVTQESCTQQGGSYTGGVRCQGGTCTSTPVESCAVNQDCPNEDCDSTLQERSQPSPCPLCEFESGDNCQPFEDVLEFGISSRNVGSVIADDFVPPGSTLTNVCVWGFYLDIDPDANSNDCALAVPQDRFRIRIFANDPVTGRMPGTLVGESMATSQRGILPDTECESRLQVSVYGFELTLDSPIGVGPGTTYWLEVSNDPSVFGPPQCVWFWNQKTPTLEAFSFAGTQGSYEPGFEMPVDQVFCTNFGIEPSTMGLLDGACCRCDESCSAKTLLECGIDNGIWDVTHATCAGVTCPTAPPVNDNCVDGPTLITDGSYSFSNQCATTDGYGECSFQNPYAAEFDLWYQYIAPSECVLTVGTCQTGLRMDSMLIVYHDSSNPTLCSECPLDAQTHGETVAGLCQDESCLGVAIGGGGMWNSQDQIGRPAMAGECFLIRIGGFPGSRGTGILDVSCDACIPNTAPVCEPMPFEGTRFIAIGCGLFHPCLNPTPVIGAVRVRLASLHHVNPPYTGGPSIPFTSFEGQIRWLGPPAQYAESSTQSPTFWVSQLQCTPHYRDWNSFPAVYVTGTEIVPSSTYEYELLAESCIGTEDTCTDVSPTFEAKTTRWGDVTTPYNPPDPSVQPDISDVSALVDKFRNAAGAPGKARAILAGEPGNPFGRVTHEVLSVDFGFSHISACVDAFRGAPYPYTIGACP